MTDTRYALTMGDVNGVGPEIVAKALARGDVLAAGTPVVYGHPDILERAARTVGVPLSITQVDSPEDAACDGAIAVYAAGAPALAYQPGLLSAEAGAAALTWIEAAVQDALHGRVGAVVTGPVNKRGLYLAGCEFAGHTDLIAERTDAPDYRMCLFSERMRVVHTTAHCALRDAIAACTPEAIERSIRLGHDALLRLGVGDGRIAVCGLNPHASEEGAFGSEEAERILPAMEAARAGGIRCEGPVSPDAVFRQMYEGAYDLVVAMYHDQGHIAVKMIAMDEAVNVTLGIPIVRTSPDHGTAYDIAGTGAAREHSLAEAIHLAMRFAKSGEPALRTRP